MVSSQEEAECPRSRSGFGGGGVSQECWCCRLMSRVGGGTDDSLWAKTCLLSWWEGAQTAGVICVGGTITAAMYGTTYCPHSGLCGQYVVPPGAEALLPAPGSRRLSTGAGRRASPSKAGGQTARGGAPVVEPELRVDVIKNAHGNFYCFELFTGVRFVHVNVYCFDHGLIGIVV